MKLTIAVVIASILILGLADFSDATFYPFPPAPKPQPPAPKPKPPAPKPKPPAPKPQPPCNPPPPPPPPVKPKPPVQPCPPPCGPGGVTCQGCPNRDGLCQDLIKQIRDLDTKIKQCVCGVKYV